MRKRYHVKESEDMMPSKVVPRESDNPILEEYKEDLSHKPGYAIHPPGKDEQRLARLEETIGEMQQIIAGLEKRINILEEK
jgi:hypothetical protein